MGRRKKMAMSRFFYLAFAAAVPFVSFCAMSAKDEIEVAKSALGDGLWQVAIAHAEKAAGDPSLKTEAEKIRFEALLGSGMYKQVLDEISSSGDMSSEYLRFFKAAALIRLGEDAKALETLSGCENFKDAGYAAKSLAASGRIKLKSGDGTGAAESFRLAVAKAASDAEALQYAFSYMKLLNGLSRNGEAMAFAESFLLPESAKRISDAESGAGCEMQLLQAKIAADAGDAAKAIDFLDRAAKVRVAGSALGLVRAEIAVSNVLAMKGATNEAVGVSRKAVETAKGTPLEKDARDNLSATLCRFDGALLAEGTNALMSAYLANPSDPAEEAFVLNQAASFAASKRPRLAGVFYETVKKFSADKAALKLVAESLAQVYEDSGETELAAKAYLEAAGFENDGAKKAGFFFKGGTALAGIGKENDAAGAFLEAEKTAPGTDIAHLAAFNRGCIFEKSGEYAKAQEAFAAAVRTTGAKAFEAELRIAVCMSKLGDDAAASSALTKLLDKSGLPGETAVQALELRGRANYRLYRFDSAAGDFAKVAEAVPARIFEMNFLSALCLYGEGRDVEAYSEAVRIFNAASEKNDPIAGEIGLWLAKYDFNNSDWAGAKERFHEYARSHTNAVNAAEALVWAARASCALGEWKEAVSLISRAVENYPSSPLKPEALLVQAQALMALSRYDEAVVVVERAEAAVDPADCDAGMKHTAAVMKADCFYAMGADNDRYYVRALDLYKALCDSPDTQKSLSESLAAAFKTARTLEKLGRAAESEEKYYTGVFYAYMDRTAKGEYADESSKGYFARAAFIIADRLAASGKRRKAVKVLRKVVLAKVPASDEAERKINAIASEVY